MRYSIGLLALTVIAAMASAQSSNDPLETCSTKPEAADRLACFDREMQRRHETKTQAEVGDQRSKSSPTLPNVAKRVEAPAVDVVPARSAPATAAANEQENFGLEGQQLRRKLRQEGVVAPPPPKPISALVARADASPDHRFTVLLDNGQVWEQTQARSGFYLAPREAVTIGPGALGSFFMETSGHAFVRVRRIE